MNFKNIGNALVEGLIHFIMSLVFTFPWMLIWNYGWAPQAGFPQATYLQAFTVLFLAKIVSGNMNLKDKP